jgi:ABC-type branched-subunit amino acid transport system substrate-binding protein
MKLPSKILTSLFIVSFFSNFILTSCKSNDPPKHYTVVSALLPLSGDLAFLGEPGRHAIDIATEKLIDKGINLRFEIHDTKADPKEAVSIVRRERDVNNRDIFLVTLSGPSLAVRETLTNTNTLMLSVAIHPDLPSNTAPIIRFCPSAAQEALLLTDRLDDSPNPVALVVSRDAATTFQVNNILLPALKDANKPVAFVEWFDVGNKDFKNLAAKLTANPATEIVLLGYGSDFPAALESIKQARGSSPTTILGGIGFVEISGKPDGMNNIQILAVVPAFCVDSAIPGASEFQAAYLAKTGKPAPYDAAYTYDAAITLGNLVESGLTTANDILNALRGTTITGVTGKIIIDNNGEVRTDLRWATLSQDGLQTKR